MGFMGFPILPIRNHRCRGRHRLQRGHGELRPRAALAGRLGADAAAALLPPGALGGDLQLGGTEELREMPGRMGYTSYIWVNRCS
jgi:hypothetical protein